MPSWVYFIVLGFIAFAVIARVARAPHGRTARPTGDRPGIRKGRTREELLRGAGEPTSSMTGAGVLGEFTSVTGSADSLGAVAAMEFMIFRDHPQAGRETRVTLNRGRVQEVVVGNA